MAQPVKAKKHLGQHFLVDENIAKKIADALLDCNSGLSVIEVGPGTGVLTKYLLDKVKLVAMDIDRESIEFLKANYPKNKEQILEADFLKTELNSIVNGSHFNVIGNFPYNVSTQIMFKVLEYKDQIDCVVGMFQKEVAERIAEKPGTKTYGILSVLLQAYYDIEYLFTVHEHVFSPAPKVKSAVIRLKRNKVVKLNCKEDLFFKVVKTTFNQRRKTIRNSIKPLINAGQNFENLIFSKRPEQLSVEQFVELTNLISV